MPTAISFTLQVLFKTAAGEVCRTLEAEGGGPLSLPTWDAALQLAQNDAKLLTLLGQMGVSNEVRLLSVIVCEVRMAHTVIKNWE